LVVTGDHGESLGEHGEREHGLLLYEATLHVPLVIAGPGVAAGSVVRRQVRHVDVMPTVLALVGVKAPGQLDGTNLAPNLGVRPRSDPDLTPVRPRSDPGLTPVRPQSDPHPTLSYAESRFGELHFGWSPIRSIRDGTWKFIDAPTPELYDLSKDAAERTNRHDARRETAAALARALGEVRSASRPAAAAPDSETAARLRSLG